MKKLFSIFLLMLFTTPAFTQEVLSFSPEGNVKEIKQVVIKFKTEMIPLGDPKQNLELFYFTCTGSDKNKNLAQPTHQVRWADTKTLIYDFESYIPAGFSCKFVLSEAAKDLQKRTVKATRDYFFSTGGPRVISQYPYANDSIENDQYFILQVDGDFDLTALSNAAYFEVAGINEKVKLKVINDKSREEVIGFGIERNYDWYQLRRTYELIKNNKKELQKFQQENYKNFIVVAAERRFPDGAKVILHLPAGLPSTTGLVSEVEYKYNYTAIPPLKAEFSCSRTTAEVGCNPIEDVVLSFSNEMKANDLRDIKVIGPNNQTYIPEEFKKTNKKGINDDSTLYALKFKGPFLEKSNYKVVIPKKIKDAIGRSLSNFNMFPLSFKTEGYSPLIKFNGRFGILEWDNGKAALPVSVRNVEKKVLFNQADIEGKLFNISSLDQAKKVIDLYERVIMAEEWPDEKNDPRNKTILAKNEGKLFFFPKPSSESEYEMTGIGLPNPGFYAIEVQSPRLGEALTTSKKTMYVQTTALVTNMAIHFKKGLESSLIWVTHLNDSSPVEGAKISIRQCDGTEIVGGVTDKNGIFKTRGLAYIKKIKTCKDYRNSLYVFAAKDNDFSFLSSDWDKGIETYRYSVPTKYFYQEKPWEDVLIHTVLDRVLFKPNETVSMKHFFREHHENGFTYLAKKNFPVKVIIKHSSSEKSFSIPLVVDEKTSSSLTTFKLPKEAPTGRYDIYISNKLTKKKTKKLSSIYVDDENYDGNFDYDAKLTASFVISDYRLPVMQATAKIKGNEDIRPTNVSVDLSAQYLSGGPAIKLPIKVRKQILESTAMPEFVGSEEFSYYAAKIQEGLIQENQENNEDTAESIESKEAILDNAGGAVVNFPVKKIDSSPKRVQVEMEYVDPNGEIKTANNYKTIYPSNYVIGVKVDSWISSPDETKLEGIVVNLKNERVKNQKYKVVAYSKTYYSHRKRLVGGFYSYDSKTEIKKIGTVCEGNTEIDGTFKCLAKNLPAGYVYLQAETADENGNEVFARTDIEVFEKGIDIWWTPGDSDRIDLLAEKKMSEPNEIAKIMVKTPFKEATALVTVEREGILDSFVTKVFRDKPIIEVPIKKNYAPNVYISVALVRGRIEEAKHDFMVDLNRPAIKMGLIPLKVGWKSHLLNVTVKTDKKKYNTRDNVDVSVQLTKADGEKLPSGSIVTLIAFDEALVLLKKNDTFDILQSMMGERPLAVNTSSGQTQVIGRRHFGSKAKLPGGGGGTDGEGASRELFDPLLAYFPNVVVGEDGLAKIKIKLNDSMTSFRIVAVATNGPNLFGYGKTEIVSSKDLLIYSGASPVVREGDLIKNKYTVRNTTDKQMDVDFLFKVIELAGKTNDVSEKFKLDPSESKVITVPLSIPDELEKITYQVKAIDNLSKASDSLKSSITVSKKLKDAVQMATLFQLEKPEMLSVEEHKDSIKGSGGIEVKLNASLLTGLTGVKEYMEEYPYSCLEQQVSKAVVAENKNELKKLANSLESYMDADGLLKYFNSEYSCGSEMLSIYVLSILRENEISIPTNTKFSILNGLHNALYGNLSCNVWWKSYLRNDFLDQEKVKIMAALSYDGKFQPEMLQSIKLAPNDWTIETLLSFKELLLNSKTIRDRDGLLTQTNNILLSRANYQGTMLNLQSSLTNISRRSLFSSSDQESALYLLSAIKDEGMNDDTGKIARGVVSRLKKGIFDSTTANAWAVTAFAKFSKKFENTPIVGQTEIKFNNIVKNLEIAKNKNTVATFLKWPNDRKVEAVSFKQIGTGKPWVTVKTRSAIPLSKPLDLGYLISKKIAPVVQKSEGKFSVGDIVNVELTIKAQSDQSWVAISDPIPSGASHLGNGLLGESEMLDKPRTFSQSDVNDYPIEFEEKRNTQYIGYAGYLPAGTYKINYRIRLNSAGKFNLPNTRIEAMYDSECFGESPNELMEINE